LYYTCFRVQNAWEQDNKNLQTFKTFFRQDERSSYRVVNFLKRALTLVSKI